MPEPHNQPEYCSRFCRRWLCFLSLLFAVNSSVAQVLPDPRANDDADREFRQARLSERLVHDRELARLLRFARAEIRDGRSDSAVAALRRLFAAPADAFHSDPEHSSGSLRFQSLSLLRSAPPAFQSNWRAAVEPFAAQELNDAVNSRSPVLLRRTAAHFPLTDSGFVAHVMSVSQKLRTGDQLLSAAAVAEFAQTYAQSVFADRARDAMYRWSLLSESHPTSANASKPRTLIPPIARPAADLALSRPWPVPIWKWRDNLADAPLTLRPGVSNALQQFMNGHPPFGKGFSDYTPIRWNELLIHRTPLRIIGINRTDGRVVWQIPTDTLVDVPNTKPSIRPGSGRHTFNSIAEDATRFAICGMTSVDPQMLFFVDGFNLFAGTTNQSYTRNIFQNRGRPFVPVDALNAPAPDQRTAILGSRLVAVALRTQSEPVVAWIAGEQPDAPYGIVDDVSMADHATQDQLSRPAGEDDQASGLEGHLFYSAPCGDSAHVYILTVAEDQVWLNSLQKSTGQLVWQQPICMKPDSLVGVESGWVTNAATGSCVQVRDTIICCIPDGMIVSVSGLTGDLNWATTIASVDRRPGRRGLLSRALSRTDTTSVFVPVIHEDRILWSSAASSDVYCLDANSGRSAWRVSKHAAGPGNIASSKDCYCVGVVGNQAVMVGEHHCRSLDMASGIQNWSVELKRQPGRAIMDGNKCLIPESHGGITVVDLTTGLTDRVANRFLPRNGDPLYGALSIDDTYVSVCTPGSVTQFERADMLLDNRSGSTTRTLDPIERAQVVLLTQGRAAALDDLTQSASDRTANLDFARVADFAAELMLLDIGRHQFHSESPGPDPDDADIRRHWTRLAAIPLTKRQRVRAYLLHELLPSHQRTDHDWKFDPDVFADEWRRTQPVDGNWFVRPDVLRRELSPEQDDASSRGTATESLTPNPSPADLILFASNKTPIQQNLDHIDTFAGHGQLAAAEMLADVLFRTADETERIQLVEALDRAHLSPTADSVRRAAIPSKPAESYVISEQQSLSSVSPLIQEIIVRRPIVESLYDSSILAYLTDAQDGAAIGTLDLKHGAVADRIKIATSQRMSAHRAVAGQQPGLIISAGDSSLTAIHCRPDGQLKQLWARRPVPSDDEYFVRRLGVFGPDYLLWQSETRLHCSHPLTGRDIWSREATVAEPGVLMMSSPMLFGDESVTVIVGADLRSFRRYSTRTGRFLGSGRTDLDRTQPMIASGSRLIGVKPKSTTLSIHDFETDREILTHENRIELAGDSTFRQLPSGNVVAITRSRDIVVIDPRDGQVMCRCSVANALNTEFVFGFVAFERNGRLLVAINDERSFGEHISAAPRLGEPRCDFGPLFCVNLETGVIDWHRRMEPTVFPTVHDTDLLVGWSIVRQQPGRGRRAGQGRLRLQIIDLRNGRLLGSHDNLFPGIPFLCHVDAESGDLIIQTYRSTIVASPAVRPPDTL
jgi:outer membrane protein assembly factor BamB